MQLSFKIVKLLFIDKLVENIEDPPVYIINVLSTIQYISDEITKNSGKMPERLSELKDILKLEIEKCFTFHLHTGTILLSLVSGFPNDYISIFAQYYIDFITQQKHDITHIKIIFLNHLMKLSLILRFAYMGANTFTCDFNNLQLPIPR